MDLLFKLHDRAGFTVYVGKDVIEKSNRHVSFYMMVYRKVRGCG
ncbi:hypothetical protein PALB_35130 [Pseudoalteromonas luteoviolacea B = ATCC 29581]|nr:hypothetical protein PALB_35130 [Pseudoalteromonas luteoviolacea B = ATCC 29581]